MFQASFPITITNYSQLCRVFFPISKQTIKYRQKSTDTQNLSLHRTEKNPFTAIHERREHRVFLCTISDVMLLYPVIERSSLNRPYYYCSQISAFFSYLNVLHTYRFLFNLLIVLTASFKYVNL